MATVERYCGYCGSRLTAEGGGVNPRRRPKGWNTPVEMAGRRFGKLTVVEMVPDVTPRKWKCVCQCGRFYVTTGDALRRGLTRSCGCIRKGKKEGQDAGTI
jgi:hypothetical protein